MMRAPVSVPPPGGKGTTSVTGRVGQAPCAKADAAASESRVALSSLFMGDVSLCGTV
jgi:hypothetical protein